MKSYESSQTDRLEVIYTPDLQRPDLGIETVETSKPELLKQEDYDWLSEDMKVNTVKLKLAGLEETIRYGSAVSGNTTLLKIASRTPQSDSESAERSLFKGLVGFISEDGLPPNFERTVSINAKTPVFKSAKRGKNSPRLFFTAFRDRLGTPVVIKLAVGVHDKQQQMYVAMSKSTTRRRKKDG